MRRGPREPGGALHNMSAPPRMQLAIRPLRPAGKRRRGASAAPRPGAEAGMARVATVCLETLVRRVFPRYRDRVSDDDGRPGWAGRGKGRRVVAEEPHLRLRCLVVLSRIALGELRKPNRGALRRLADVPVPELEATWLRNTARLRAGEHDLPAFGLVRPADDGGGEECEESVARALAIVSRSAGSVFSSGRQPTLPDWERPLPRLQLYAFPPAGRRSP